MQINNNFKKKLIILTHPCKNQVFWKEKQQPTLVTNAKNKSLVIHVKEIAFPFDNNHGVLDLPRLTHPQRQLFKQHITDSLCYSYVRVSTGQSINCTEMKSSLPESSGKVRRLNELFPCWPVDPLKPEQSRNNGLWWPDQRLCCKTSPYGACPQWDPCRLPLAFIPTMDQEAEARRQILQCTTVLKHRSPYSRFTKEKACFHWLFWPNSRKSNCFGLTLHG